MPTTYGVTPTGFVRKPQSVILAEIERDQLANISADWDISAESPNGQVNASIARQLSLIWELGETVYNSNDPDKAEDFLLTALCKLTGTERDPAQYSTVAMTLNIDEGTLLESGVNFVEDEDDTTSRWTPLEDYTSPSDGTHTGVIFRSENKGPFAAAGGKLTVISTPVTGWNSATNPGDATPGRNVAEDPELRADREAQIANAAGATVAGIKAALEKLVTVFPGSSVLAFENTTATADSNGLPANSFEMVVWDGSDDGTNVLADDIAKTIWKKKGSGARPYGSLSGNALDANGDTQPVGFSRSTVVPIYVAFELEVTDDFDSAAFRLAIATAADSVFTGSKDVLQSRLVALAWQQPNIENVVRVRLDLTPAPVVENDIPIGIREIARFDTSRITVAT
jgi:hypothetical protein